MEPAESPLAVEPGASDLDALARIAGATVESVRDAGFVEHRLAGVRRRFRRGLTFTPYFSARPCSARCAFCSETLRRTGQRVMAASLRPGAAYREGLDALLEELRGLPFGLSLSGLEATDDPGFLEQVLEAFGHHAEAGGRLLDRVMYSNAAGLVRELHGARLLPRLAAFGLDRIELSRHSDDPGRNQRIMRFRPGQPIVDGAVFARTVKDILEHVPIKLVCVAQRGGVDSPAALRAYLRWAESLGIRDVVVRELCRLEGYAPGAPLEYVEGARIPVEPLLAALLDGGGFRPEQVRRGYYYANVRGRFGALDVTFEASDYSVMQRRHASDEVHKLVYFADGRLCGDWDPGAQVLWRA